MIVAVNASHQPATANLYLLDAFCIVFLGSTILKEGKPHILGTVIAGIMLSGLVTGMMLMGVRYEWQMFVKGTVLVLAMAASVMMGHEGIRTRFV
jgi:ribose/xylose/arabinose/galactoside ABC-type transport system permease subunit